MVTKNTYTFADFVKLAEGVRFPLTYNCPDCDNYKMEVKEKFSAVREAVRNEMGVQDLRGLDPKTKLGPRANSKFLELKEWLGDHPPHCS